MDSTVSFGNWNKGAEEILTNRYPLHRACRDGDLEALSYLLQSPSHRSAVLVEDEFYGWSPSHWAAYFGKLSCLCQVMQLLPHEPTTSRYQQTPAHLAAYAGHTQCLQWLLLFGCDIRRQDYMGETPVHKAARTGSLECLSFLASKDAVLNQPNSVGRVPAEVAAFCGHADCALYLQRVAEQQLLKCQGLIQEVVLPMIPTSQVLPGQKPDRQLMAQGINGGFLPNCFESDQVNGSFADHSMETSAAHPFHSADAQSTGFQFGNPCDAVPNNDILLSEAVSRNQAPVAGRKRCREDLVDSLQQKRACPFFQAGSYIQASPHCLTSMESSSTVEHAHSLIAHQLYDSLMFDTLLEVHGA